MISEINKDEFKQKCENLEQYLNSDCFYEVLMVAKTVCEETEAWKILNLFNGIFGTIISYHLLFDNNKDNFIQELNIIISEIIEHCQVFESSVDYRADIIQKMFLEKIQRDNINEEKLLDKYVFHAFAPGFLESIKENGINPYVKKEMFEKMKRLGCEKGIDLLFCSSDNEVDIVSYSLTPFNSYKYSQTSPELFHNFMLGGVWNEDIDENAYILKDYDTCRRNLDIIIKIHNFENDKDNFLAFFEKCWELFDYDYSMLAIIPYHDNLLDINININTDTTDVEGLLNEYLHSYYYNEESEEIIDVTDASFVKMPSLRTIYKRLGINKYKSNRR